MYTYLGTLIGKGIETDQRALTAVIIEKKTQGMGRRSGGEDGLLVSAPCIWFPSFTLSSNSSPTYMMFINLSNKFQKLNS